MSCIQMYLTTRIYKYVYVCACTMYMCVHLCMWACIAYIVCRVTVKVTCIYIYVRIFLLLSFRSYHESRDAYVDTFHV